MQFEKNDSYQGMPSGVPQKQPRMSRFSGCDGQSQRLKPFSLLRPSAASLTRSPDTNRSSQTDPLPRAYDCLHA
jgi:hypothetical protein